MAEYVMVFLMLLLPHGFANPTGLIPQRDMETCLRSGGNAVRDTHLSAICLGYLPSGEIEFIYATEDK